MLGMLLGVFLGTGIGAIAIGAILVMARDPVPGSDLEAQLEELFIIGAILIAAAIIVGVAMAAS